MKHTQEQITGITCFIAPFSNPEFAFGHWSEPNQDKDGFWTMPYYTLSAEAEAFVQACYDADWIANYQWSEFAASDEGQRLRDDPTILAEASEEQLSKLLTIIVRQQRFVEGSLADAFSSGLILRILQRAQELGRVEVAQ